MFKLVRCGKKWGNNILIDIVIVSNFKKEKHHNFFFPNWYHIPYHRGCIKLSTAVK